MDIEEKQKKIKEIQKKWADKLKTPDYEALEEKLKKIRSNLPESPGVYRFYDHQQNLLYVGKSINLKHRVNSYFHPSANHSRRIQEMVNKIRDIQYTIVHSDIEALMLECNLIKEYQPKYNILMRDGKSYPYICIKKEPFPRVFTTRNKVADGSEYFGPFAISGTMSFFMNFIQKNFKLRNCNYALTQENIQKQKFKPCLEFQIGNCLAPCVGYQNEEDYNEQIQQIRSLLKGNFEPLIDYWNHNLQKAVTGLDFETAHQIKQKIEKIKAFQQKNTIITGSTAHIEVIAIQTFEDLAVIVHFKVTNGSIVSTRVFDTKIHEESLEELLFASLEKLIFEEGFIYQEIITNVPIEKKHDFFSNYKFYTPKQGDKAKVLSLALKNAETLLQEKILLYKEKKKNPQEEVLRQLQKDLNLEHLPVYIECFDNSNIQGYAPVSSIVVFRNGKPSKKEYRCFHVKTVEGPDDFATMYEAVYRRYKRLLEEEKELPQLVIIDGGKGQLAKAYEALTALHLEKKIALISIAKRLEEIYFPYDSAPLHIDKKSASLKLIQYIRNEAHDNGVKFHRKTRDKKTIHTELTRIQGIGENLAQKLLQEFQSLKKIKNASVEELSNVIGKAKAKIVFDYFHQEEGNNDG
ncbi:MAG: UvrABC system protein C [Bacteroidia bacterium]|nr:MAG: UvrABC system protein C [Bacteroidia bacterium]